MGRGKLCDAGRRVDRELVGQQHGERLAADPIARTPHGVAQSQRLLLAGEYRIARLDGGLLGLLQLARLAALLQRRFQLIGRVEMILECALVAAGDEDELLDARRQAFLDGVLDQRPVDDRQHLLRHCLGGGQESGAQSGHRQDSFADALRHAHRPRSTLGLYGHINDLTELPMTIRGPR